MNKIVSIIPISIEPNTKNIKKTKGKNNANEIL